MITFAMLVIIDYIGDALHPDDDPSDIEVEC